MNKIKVVAVILLVIVFSITSSTVVMAHKERPIGQHFTLVDEDNNIIHQTSMEVYVGDEYISEDNSRYEVVEIVGDTARCVYKGKEKMPDLKYDKKKQAWIFPDGSIPAVSLTKKTIAVYCTHSDESYVPSDGTESIPGDGGIYDVAQVFADEMRKQGFEVQYDKSNHNPHDVNAYNRSRRTAAKLLKQNPDAIFDVHRDAVPAEQYKTEVEGQDETKIKMVVGRSNPNSKTNLEFAKSIKAVMDKEKPGLSNGIFIGKGDYNQDLSPRAMLLEVGSHITSKEDAKQSVVDLAQIVPSVLGVSTEGAAKKPIAENSQGAGTVILVIIIIVAAAAGGFYLLNKGTKTNG